MFHGTIIYRINNEDVGLTQTETEGVKEFSKRALISKMRKQAVKALHDGVCCEHEQGFTIFPPHTIMSINTEIKE